MKDKRTRKDIEQDRIKSKDSRTRLTNYDKMQSRTELKNLMDNPKIVQKCVDMFIKTFG